MSMPSGVTIGTGVETGSALVAAVAVPANSAVPRMAAVATAKAVRCRDRRGDMGGGTPSGAPPPWWGNRGTPTLSAITQEITPCLSKTCVNCSVSPQELRSPEVGDVHHQAGAVARTGEHE